MLISIVIPVYNSVVTAEIVERLDAVFAARGERHEIVFVDDFSPDARVWPELVRLAERHRHVRSIQLTRNFGQHAATLCGLREARGDLVVTMDDDLEHSPEDLPKLLALSGHDVVLAQLRHRRHSLVNRIGSRIKGRFDALILGKPRHIRFSSYRLLSRIVVDGMLSIRTARPFIPALILHVTQDLAGVDIIHQPRRSGRSSYTFWKRWRLFNDLLIHNSSLVLRLVGQVGALMALVSFAVAGWVVYRKIVFSRAMQGWTSLIAAELLIGGLLLVAVGVIGEYLIRIIESTDERPTYLVRRRAGEDAARVTTT
jgi:dolichol-phosphate mannosyltransferase/undecaprenyl-phosphate 4-deoxy-4-formamido-L-arabinose transferase